MVDTIIFDAGNVLVRYDWQSYLKGFHYPDDIYEKVADAMFRSRQWAEFDRSALSDEEILKSFIHNCPECQKEIEEVFEQVGGAIQQLDYAESWLKELKEKGYKLYILSNYSRKAFAHTRHYFDFLKHIDGSVFSYEVKKVKPEPEMYQELLRRYNIRPEQAVFLDDLQMNLEAADKFGINTVLFKNKEQAEEEMTKFGIL